MIGTLVRARRVCKSQIILPGAIKTFYFTSEKYQYAYSRVARLHLVATHLIVYHFQ